MIGVVVATHGKLAEEMIRTAQTVVGPLEQVRGVSFDAAAACEMRGEVASAIRSVDTGDGVLLLTDLLGGSPTNLCLSFLAELEVEVVTGVNLPMLLKLGGLRSSGHPIAQVAHELAEAGKKSIGHASEMLRRIV
jgi:PTS system mannose-specific IIA component